MKVTIEINDGLAGYQFKDDNNEVSQFENMSRVEQIMVLNSFVNGYELFIRCLKKE